MLSLGSSKQWQEPLQALTGGTQVSAQSLIKYFQPLMDFLKEVNGNDYGWNEECPDLNSVSSSSSVSISTSVWLAACVVFLLGLVVIV